MHADLDAYVECALWSSIDTTEDGDTVSLDEYEESPGLRDQLAPDLDAFMNDPDLADDLADMDPGQAAHDFWLTRNGHGTGFWDRGLGERGERLTAAAHAYGGVDLYLGDDGLVYAQ